MPEEEAERGLNVADVPEVENYDNAGVAPEQAAADLLCNDQFVSLDPCVARRLCRELIERSQHLILLKKFRTGGSQPI